MPSYPSDNPLPPNPTPITPSPVTIGLNSNQGGQNPAGTTSLTVVMMGLGVGTPAWVFTPLTTGRLAVTAAGSLANSTASDGAQAHLRWGLGTPPANGAAITGTQLGGTAFLANNASTAAAAMPLNLEGVITGLTPGVPIWVDVGLRAVTGGTATVANVAPTVSEF